MSHFKFARLSPLDQDNFDHKLWPFLSVGEFIPTSLATYRVRGLCFRLNRELQEKSILSEVPVIFLSLLWRANDRLLSILQTATRRIEKKRK